MGNEDLEEKDLLEEDDVQDELSDNDNGEELKEKPVLNVNKPPKVW